jgi:hypothetical protein
MAKEITNTGSDNSGKEPETKLPEPSKKVAAPDPAKIKAVYNGSQPCIFTLNKVEYALHKGETYELPADHSRVKSLLKQQLLTITTK